MKKPSSKLLLPHDQHPSITQGGTQLVMAHCMSEYGEKKQIPNDDLLKPLFFS